MKTRTGVILAAGWGERLDSQDSLKPLVHIGHKSLIIWNVERMQETGLDNIYVVLGYGGELIEKELLANPFVNTKIKFINNPKWQDGMLSSISVIGDIIKEPFFLSPCDLFFEYNPFDIFFNDDMQFNGVTSLICPSSVQEDFTGANLRINVLGDGSISYVKVPDLNSSIETGIYHFGADAVKTIKSVTNENGGLRTLPLVFEHLSKIDMLKVLYLKQQTWFDVNTPSVRIRAEMFLRKQPINKSKRVNIRKRFASLDPFSTFFTRKEIETEIYVKQDCLSEIDTIELIPENHTDSPHFLITDENVDKLFGEDVFRKLRSIGYNISKIVLSSGETSKTLQNYISLSERILTEGIDERSILISLGGGTVNNVTGFLASTLYRGIYLIHIPTTLMAQCDAAISIKQAVNGDKGKNLIGSYYEPLKIIVDPSALITSDEFGLRDGLSECIKHAIAQDPNFYAYLMDYHGEINDVDFLEYVVKKNIELKTKLIDVDPKEKAEALVLQYGHTVGHAVEYLSGYKFGHGGAVSIGMVAAARISALLDIADNELVDVHYNILEKYRLPLKIDKQIKVDDIITALRYNKRYLYGDVQLVLLDSIGSLWNYDGDYHIPCGNDILTRSLAECY